MNTSEDLRILETVMSFSPDLICVVNPKGNFLQVSAACQRALGYTDLEMVNKPFADVLHPDNRRATLQKCLDAFGQDEAVTFDSRCLSKDGREVFIAWSALRTAANELLICIGRDVTAERQATRQAHEQDALHRAIINHCFEMVALLNEQGIYTYVGGATETSLGYPPEHLVGRSAFDYIHPDDLERVQNDWNMVTTRHVFTAADFRFRAANGEWRWVETTVYNELDNPAIRAFVASSRDVTERHASNQALAASEQRFRLLFETSTTLAVFQAADGAIVDANLAFLNAFQRRKHQVVNRPLSRFLPKELRLLFAEKLAGTVTGHQVRFRATVNGWQGQKKLMCMSITPLQADGQTVGVYVTAKDETELATAQHLVKKSRESSSAPLWPASRMRCYPSTKHTTSPTSTPKLSGP